MLPLSANPDFDDFDNAGVVNPYYDLNTEFGDKIEIYGTDALDQALENILCTEPYERLFNPTFWSPLYSILFENGVNIESKMENVYDVIENFVPIKIDRNNTDVKFDATSHELSLKLPYYYTMYGTPYYHTFSRIVGR